MEKTESEKEATWDDLFLYHVNEAVRHVRNNDNGDAVDGLMKAAATILYHERQYSPRAYPIKALRIYYWCDSMHPALDEAFKALATNFNLGVEWIGQGYNLIENKRNIEFRKIGLKVVDNPEFNKLTNTGEIPADVPAVLQHVAFSSTKELPGFKGEWGE